MTIHQAIQQRVLTRATIYDGRIRHLPAAIRRCRRDGVLSGIIAEAMTVRPSGTKQRASESTRAMGRAMHRVTGLSGDALRQLIYAVTRGRGGEGFAHLPASDAASRSVPDSCLDGLIGRIRAERVYVDATGHAWTAKWASDGRDESTGVERIVRMALIDVVAAPAWAECEGRARLAACESDEQYRISGYLASSIRSWQHGTSGYEGCSGCESYAWHRAHPEQWSTLMAHAPIGAKGDGWEQVYPHEHERIESLQARGWFHTLRLNDSIYTATNPLTGA